jgi:hypothetical protein|nr:MAG TPA: hypothetical protein [Caudoviricetes sp.]
MVFLQKNINKVILLGLENTVPKKIVKRELFIDG